VHARLSARGERIEHRLDRRDARRHGHDAGGA
jgi:hypothetical protein